MANNEKERVQLQLRERSISLWSYLNHQSWFDPKTGLVRHTGPETPAADDVSCDVKDLRFRNLIYKPFESPLLNIAWTLHSLVRRALRSGGGAVARGGWGERGEGNRTGAPLMSIEVGCAAGRIGRNRSR